MRIFAYQCVGDREMGLIFISHSSRDNAEALAMQDWLARQGWGEVFLDLDPATGLAPGQRWRDELRKAGERCSAVVVLISPHWAASKWCLTEFLFASQLGKRSSRSDRALLTE